MFKSRIFGENYIFSLVFLSFLCRRDAVSCILRWQLWNNGFRFIQLPASRPSPPLAPLPGIFSHFFVAFSLLPIYQIQASANASSIDDSANCETMERHPVSESSPPTYQNANNWQPFGHQPTHHWQPPTCNSSNPPTDPLVSVLLCSQVFVQPTWCASIKIQKMENGKVLLVLALISNISGKIRWSTFMFCALTPMMSGTVGIIIHPSRPTPPLRGNSSWQITGRLQVDTTLGLSHLDSIREATITVALMNILWLSKSHLYLMGSVCPDN